MTKLLLATILFALTAHAQSWVRVATEGQSVIFNSSPITVRFGAPAGSPVQFNYPPCVTVGGCWTPGVVVTSGPPFTMVAAIANFHVPDPAVGTVKEMDVLQTGVVQSVTVLGKVVTVPAAVIQVVPPPAGVVYKITLASGGSLTLTMSPDGSSFTLAGTGIQVTKQ